MRRLAALSLLLSGAPVLGQGIVVSPGPENVAVSVYRAPDRDTDQAMELDWLQGYALITEKRTVQIPAGKATVRFEGVAAGLFPESAIVTGLPSGVHEKNLDADLLSPRSLYARMFGRPVILRRTDLATDKVREERAVIRSGPDGAAIVQTASGFEVANCGGLEDEILYPEAPKDLSARPTLSIETESPVAQTATISLSYLAWGFDWQANYVVRMAPDGRTAELSAWATLASSDSTSFADAETALIAGEVRREDAGRGTRPTGGELELQCSLSPVAAPALDLPPSPVMALPAPPPAMEMADIVVTAQRAAPMNAPVMVQQEGLGDLKLYRVPVPVTVAANAQKQVALAHKQAVKMEALYRAEVFEGGTGEVRQMLRTRNRKEEGLGLPLPGGPVSVFEPYGAAMMLSGEGGVTDRAVGDDVEIMLGAATQVSVDAEQVGSDDRSQTIRLTVRNARPVPIRFEARIAADSASRVQGLSRQKLGRRNGRFIWTTEVRPSAMTSLTYRIVKSD
ncbi:DUF4139 domain-containing protein [Novosphingobium jiangmenense]|uniref:DUF4139 domain-containing protein n=1 Tax=Novosphingobium jiangmenense TaxID=2791981 RepID=A0ABS0HDY4_9SPHN|nr:hypothetical protein [Novosphingobium jiangmenense]MBF9150480.1 hypothetical protein [Novosphingobium jiangmenense]